MKGEPIIENVLWYIELARKIVHKDLDTSAQKDYYYQQVIEVAKMVQKEALNN